MSAEKIRLMAMTAASLVSEARSAPTKPGVFLAMRDRSRSPLSRSFFVITCESDTWHGQSMRVVAEM